MAGGERIFVQAIRRYCADHGIAVDVRGLNEASANMLDRFALHDKGDAALASTGSH